MARYPKFLPLCRTLRPKFESLEDNEEELILKYIDDFVCIESATNRFKNISEIMVGNILHLPKNNSKHTKNYPVHIVCCA